MVSEPEATIDETSSPITFKPDTLQRVAVTAAVLAIAALLSYIPAPGLSPDGIAHVTSTTGGGAMARLSIVALGLSPILSALILAEVLKLAAPPLYNIEKNPGRFYAYNKCVLVFGLMLAAFQAYGVSIALEEIKAAGGGALVEEPDGYFRFTYIVTLVAGVALIYLLAEIITWHGIGSGFWVMLVAGELWAIPATLRQVAANLDSGQIETPQLLLLIIVIAAAICSIVALHRLRFSPADPKTPMSGLEPMDILMPPILGLSLASTLLMVGPLWDLVSGGEATFDPVSPIRLALSAAMILLFAYLRAVTRPLRGKRSICPLVAHRGCCDVGNCHCA
jgi:SecY